MNLRGDIRNIQRLVGAEADGVFGPDTARRVLAELSRVGLANPEIVPAGTLDGRSLAIVETLDEQARERFAQFLRLAKATAAAMGCDYIAISGTRTMAAQLELYRKWKAGGPKAAAPGYSWHNFGTAIDCGAFKGDGKIYLDGGSREQQVLADKVHRAVSAHAAACGLEWGGDWRGQSCDPPHFQLDMGHSSPSAADRLRFKEEGSVL